MFNDATVAALMGTPVVYHIDQTTNPVDIIDIVARQYGSLICLWGGSGRTDGGYDENLTVEVTPDAAAGYAANAQYFTAEETPAIQNTAGDQSVYGCSVDGQFQCLGNMLVGSYWVTVNLQDIGNTTLAQATATGRMQVVMSSVAGDLKNTTAPAAWNPPGAELPSFCSDNTSTAAVNSALGVTDFTVTGVDSGPADAQSYTQQPGTYDQCSWGDTESGSSSSSFSYLSLAMLKGGAWVMAELPGESDSRSYQLGAYSSITIPGADAAASSCSTGADQCDVYFTIGSVLYNVDLDDPSASLVNAALAKIVVDIKAS